ncbi:hypothetical protein EI94DRAFT_1763523, partial [Lactarius quietus]
QTVDLAAAVKLNNFHCGGGTSHATAPRDSSSGVYSFNDGVTNGIWRRPRPYLRSACGWCRPYPKYPLERLRPADCLRGYLVWCEKSYTLANTFGHFGGSDDGSSVMTAAHQQFALAGVGMGVGGHSLGLQWAFPRWPSGLNMAQLNVGLIGSGGRQRRRGARLHWK